MFFITPPSGILNVILYPLDNTARGLKACLGLLESSQRTLDDLLPVAESDLLRWVKLRNMILTAKLVSESALARDQSLGPHLRVDGHD